MYLTRKRYGKVRAVFTYVHMFTYMKDRGWCLVSPSIIGSCILHLESTPVTGLDHTSLATVVARTTQASSSFCLASSGITGTGSQSWTCRGSWESEPGLKAWTCAESTVLSWCPNLIHTLLLYISRTEFPPGLAAWVYEWVYETGTREHGSVDWEIVSSYFFLAYVNIAFPWLRLSNMDNKAIGIISKKFY